MEKEKWTKETYQEYLKSLKEQADPKYRDFHKRLTTTQYEILGIPVPKMRKIAKKISKTDLPSFLPLVQDHYYEEVLIEGFVIASIEEEKFFLEQLERFIPKIDNWAICDGFCNSLKIIEKNPNPYFDYVLNLLKSSEPFTIRVGLIILLSFYIKEENLKKIFERIDKIKSDHYYVNMGCAWLLAEMYTLYPIETEEYLKTSKINDFTMNKTISKIRDSYRITKEQKDSVLKYKRKKAKENKK